MKSEGLVESPWKKVPGGRRFFGNLTRESSTFQETVDHWASLYGQDGIFEANLAGKKYVFLCNEKKASIIFSKRPFQVKKSRRLSKAMNSLHLCGIFTAEGEDWERERRFSCSALNHKNVKNYLPTVKLVTSRSLEKWENHSEMGHVYIVSPSRAAINGSCPSSIWSHSRELVPLQEKENEIRGTCRKPLEESSRR
jgi:cytochrome P450